MTDPWTRIVAWLRRHTPESAVLLGPPITSREAERIAAMMGQPLPDDLLKWWRRSCGVTGFIGGTYIPPFYAPYSADSVMAEHQLMLDVASCPDQAELAEMEQDPAGSECALYWLPSWLPIAHDGMGELLFVDLRPGPSHGCVLVWADGDTIFPARWPSVSAMLAEIADTLEHGTEIDGRRPDAGGDGVLDWC